MPSGFKHTARVAIRHTDSLGLDKIIKLASYSVLVAGETD